jgi:hypothetical protein
LDLSFYAAVVSLDRLELAGTGTGVDSTVVAREAILYFSSPVWEVGERRFALHLLLKDRDFWSHLFSAVFIDSQGLFVAFVKAFKTCATLIYGFLRRHIQVDLPPIFNLPIRSMHHIRLKVLVIIFIRALK